MTVFKVAGLAPKIKLKLLEYLNDAKSSLEKFKPDLTDKASKQDLKFSREAKSEAQFEVEQGYDLKIPKNIDRSLSSISSRFISNNGFRIWYYKCI
jgi:hypothetical protein